MIEKSDAVVTIPPFSLEARGGCIKKLDSDILLHNAESGRLRTPSLSYK